MVPSDDDATAPTMAADTLLSTPTPAPSTSEKTPSGGPVAIAAAGARYTLGRVLGRGGMGEVRLARDPRVDRDVAVKVMRDPGASPEAVARFLREARVQGRLEHPGVVPVHDLGVDDRGAPYFAMKRLTGTTLADAIAAVASGDAAARERWPRRLLLDRLVDVCLAVEFAHERGVVHRDLKPSNIMLGDYGEAYVLDWGIARVGTEGDAITKTDLGSVDEPGDARTAAGALLGTPGYMAPEQMRGEPVDRRADVYALGCVLFEILTLQPAHPRGHEAFESTLSAAPMRPRERRPDDEVPPELDDTCARATEPDPAKRTPSTRELAASIRAYLDGDRDTARRRELASEHAERAERALASGDAGRAAAMREAGRALALDAESAAAQAVLVRALFSRPKVPPVAVVEAVRSERSTVGRIQLRAAAVLYFVFVLMVPGLVLGGLRISWPLVGTYAMVVANFALILWGSRRQRPPAGAIEVVIVCHAAQLAFAAILFGPLLVVPPFAIGSIAACLWYPSERRPALIVGVHLVALALPIILELTGVLPRTFWLDGDVIHIRPWAAGVDATYMVVLAILAVVIQTLALAGLIIHQRTQQEQAQDQIHLTKWHLDQLVPAEARR